MKYINCLCLFLGLIFLSVANAYTVSSKWTENYENVISFHCEEESDKSFCKELCLNEDACEIPEGFCRNCSGTDLYMRSLFLDMGRFYINSGKTENSQNLVSFFKEGQFISLTSQSIYNFVDVFDAPPIRLGFQRLCDYATDYPIVFLQTDSSRLPGKVRYVVCRDKNDQATFYEMLEEFDVELSK